MVFVQLEYICCNYLLLSQNKFQFTTYLNDNNSIISRLENHLNFLLNITLIYSSSAPVKRFFHSQD